MDIKELQYLLAVAEAGSLSAAAEGLYISHQGLSNAILRMEGELGFALFERTAGGMKLTDRGADFCKSARPVVEAFRNLSRTYLDGESTEIAITCAFNLIHECPLSLQRLLLNRVPGFSVDVEEHYFLQCESLLEKGDCSFCILYGPFDTERFDTVELFTRNQCIVVNRQHRLALKDWVSIADLKDEPLIMPNSKTRASSNLHALCKKAGFVPNVILESDRPLEIISLVKQNPELVARTFEEDARALADPEICILPFEGFDSTISVCLAEKKGRGLSHREQQLKQAIINSVKHPT